MALKLSREDFERVKQEEAEKERIRRANAQADEEANRNKPVTAGPLRNAVNSDPNNPLARKSDEQIRKEAEEKAKEAYHGGLPWYNKSD